MDQKVLAEYHSFFRRRKLAAIIAMMLFLLFALGGCSASPDIIYDYIIRVYAWEDLGINTSGGVVVECYDDHGGFHGDGETYIEIHFSDQAFEEKLAEHNKWQSFPLSPDVEKFVYHFGGTYWADGWDLEEHQPIPGKIPVIEHGYYALVDRQSEEEKADRVYEDEELGIFNRYSFNLTVGLYDSDRDILYILALDT